MKHALLLLLVLGLCACPNEPANDDDGDDYMSGDSGGGADDGGSVEPTPSDDSGSSDGSSGGGAPVNLPYQHTPDEIDRMIAALENDDAKQRGMAIMSLPGDPRHYQTHPELLAKVQNALVGILNDDPKASNRAAAINLLAGMGEHAKPVMPALIAKLDDPVVGEHVSYNLKSLGEVGLDALPRAIELLEAGDRKVCAHLCTGLGRLGEAAAPAVDALTKLVESHDDEFVRTQAAKALGSIGPKASSALPVLDELAKSGPRYVKSEAAKAAAKIRR